MKRQLETVLVTGGSGYIGGWCVASLLQRGYVVRTTVRDLSKEAAVRASLAKIVDPGNRLSFYAANLTADDGWDAATEGCDYVLHVASPLGVADPKDPNDLIVPAREGAKRGHRRGDQGQGQAGGADLLGGGHQPGPGPSRRDWRGSGRADRRLDQ